MGQPLRHLQGGDDHLPSPGQSDPVEGRELVDGVHELADRRARGSLAGHGQIEPLLQAAVATLESDVCPFLAGRYLECLLEASRREIELEEVLFLDLTELQEHFDTLARGLDDLELTLEDPDERARLGADGLEAVWAVSRTSKARLEWESADGAKGQAATDAFGFVPQDDGVLRVRLTGLKPGG